MNHWTGFSRTAIAAAVAAAAVTIAAPALAQNTTSGISGRVLGANGQPLAGASVSIVHAESGTTTTVQTDAQGRYNARGLRVGVPLTVTVSKDGATDKRDDVVLALAETLDLDLQLGGSQTIVVTGRGVSDKFSRTAMGAGTNLTARDLATGPSIARSLQDYARTDPRLSQTDKERGEISAAGQNSRYNKITIDGVTVSDVFGLEANTLPTAKQPISIEAIQSVQVNVANYDVTQKGYVGANVNAVTKSGTNDLHGSVYYVYRNQDMVGKRYNRTNDTYTEVAKFKEDTKGFTLGGPIIKDKLFFFVNYEELKSDRVQPEFGPVGSPLTNVAISQSSIDSLTSIAKGQYGFDPGVVGTKGQLKVKDYLAKLDWNINDSHRASIRYSRTEQDETNNGTFPNYSATALQLDSQYWTQVKTVETAVAQWFADWTPDFSTEVKFSKRDYNSVPSNNTRLPTQSLSFTGPAPVGAPAGVNTGTRFLNFGTEQSRHFNVLDTKTIDAYAGGTWTIGDHEAKFGADVAENKVYNAFFQNVFGNYTFSCVNATAANGTTPAYTYNFNGNSTTFSCATATAPQIDQAVLENYQRGRPNAYQVQVPAVGGTLDDGIAKWKLRDTGVFIQDTWKVNRQFTLMGGVRLDTLNINQKPTLNTAAAAAPVVGNFNSTTGVVNRNTGGFGRNNDVTVDGQDLLQPRVGFNWNLGSEARRMQLRGGAGLFQGEAAGVWISNPYSNTGLATRIIGCGTLGFPACSAAGGIFSANPDTQPTNFSGTTPAANVDYLQPGFNQPSVWKFNLAFEYELPWWGMVASAEALHTKNKNAVFYQHLNLGGTTRSGTDGRELYYTPQAYNPACWTVAANQASSTIVTNTAACNTSAGQSGARNRALANASFANVLLAAETKKGSTDALTLSLSQPVREGLSWALAYTRTRATEVSPLTSSVSNSNFNARSVFNPNEEATGNSAYLVRDRVGGSVNFSRAFFSSYRTSFGMFYEGRKGKPYSWTYRNDLNGDGVASNDLMYIPSGPGSGEVQFAGSAGLTAQQAEDKFWAIVNTYKELSDSKGGTVKRGGSYSPWINSFDARLSQEVPGLFAGNKGVFTVDILNVGNLLNKRWGRTNEMLFQSAGGNRRTFVSYGGLNAQGKYIYAVGDVDDYTLRQARGESQWALQVTVKYEF